MEDILDNLTEPQLAAVTHINGPLLVIAGAGSGKTRVVTRRIAWLIRQGVWPSQILAMTFTNKAAREMRERVEKLVGDAPTNLGTFHSCCARFLRHDIEKLACGRTKDFTIYDSDEQQSLLKKAIKDLWGEIPRGLTPKLASATISASKNSRISIEEALAMTHNELLSDDMVRLANEYERRMANCNAVDFDDLLFLMVRLLEERPEMQEIYQNRFRYLLVDEYQDTNHLQYQLLMLLTNREHNVHVTGDPDQSIYSWRGADYSNILSFTTDFEEAKVVKLEQNYRSTPTILNVANELISRNLSRIPKNLFTQNEDGARIVDITAYDSNAEAEWIARKICALRKNNGIPWRSCAVFYRTNSQSRAIEEFFIKNSVPYQLLGGLRFYERREIKDFLALLKIRVNPSDEISFQRVMENFPMGSGLGPKSIHQLREQAAQEKMPLLTYLGSDAFFSTLKGRSQKTLRLQALHFKIKALQSVPLIPVRESLLQLDELTAFSESLETQYGTENLDVRQDNMRSLFAKADEYNRDFPGNDLVQFLQEVALVADVDGHDVASDCVVLMTLHSCKGLEFPYVFIAGVEEGLLPHARSIEEWDMHCENESSSKSDPIEEERRLFYVGITRAERGVYLSHAAYRIQYGGMSPSTPSRFLRELPPHGIQHASYTNHRERKLD